jgi:hypothetical protein
VFAGFGRMMLIVLPSATGSPGAVGWLFPRT